jgi:uncharacterized protein
MHSAKLFVIRNVTRNSVLADRAVLAGDSKARRTGLLKRDALPEGEGLIIAPCECVHTFGMRFPIDVVFVSKKRTVLKTVSSMAKRRIAMSVLADLTVELPAGTVARTGTAAGDVIAFEAIATGT